MVEQQARGNWLWTSWGGEQPDLPRSAQRLLTDSFGVLDRQLPVAISAARVPPSRLPQNVRQRLVTAIGEAAVLTDDAGRAWHAGGQSYFDLVRRRSGDASDAPDAVVIPSHTAHVATIVRICTEERIAVVTWGGGTSVVGGLTADAGRCVALIALDLSALNRLISIDTESRLATFEPGIRTPDAEAALAEHGFTLGHVPQSFERASLGGYAVTRSAGQASSGVGRFDDLVAGCRMVTPIGELTLRPVAGSAAGPDLRRLVLGSEGTLGVVTEVTVRIRPLPTATRYEGWMAPDWQTGVAAMRRLAQDGPKPDIARLSDPEETRVSMALSGTAGLQKKLLDTYLSVRGTAGGGLVIAGFEGSVSHVHYRRESVGRTLRSAGLVPLGGKVGASWKAHRFAGPYLRDTLLDAGVLAETLETAATWSGLQRLYDAVGAALRDALTVDGRRPLVGCHMSHLYPTGASLYFTVLAAAQPGREIEQWSAAKEAANHAIVSAGGTITHHHAVGTAHRDAVSGDLGGPVGVEALRAVKAALDPAGVMNPGKLLP